MTAYELGVAAFERGDKSVPALDGALREFWQENKDTVDYLESLNDWTRGWHTSNVAAPWEDVS